MNALKELEATLTGRQLQLLQLMKAAAMVHEHGDICVCDDCTAFAHRLAYEVLIDADEDAEVHFEIVKGA